MKHIAVLIIVLMVLLSACQADLCPPLSVEHIVDPAQFPPLDTTELAAAPVLVEIGGKAIAVDRVIHGSLCNDVWRGTVYVDCDIQIAAWDEEQGPFFLDSCDLTIEPGTVVYVASHNNTAYYKGCAVCHTSKESE